MLSAARGRSACHVRATTATVQVQLERSERRIRSAGCHPPCVRCPSDAFGVSHFADAERLSLNAHIRASCATTLQDARSHVVTFQLEYQDVVDEHRFEVYDCLGHGASTLEDELAERVRELYIDREELRAAVEQAATGLGDVTDPTALDALVQRVTEAVVPVPEANPMQPAHLDLARNEVAEVIAYAAVEEIHGAVIPAKRIRDKEVPGQPTRGLDLLSLVVAPTLKLLVTEVKASSSASSPPGVVGSGADSLHSQIQSLVSDVDRLLRELEWSRKHCDDDGIRDAVVRAMLLLSLGDLPILAAPVLVRPVDRYATTDFGSFRLSPGDYPPALIAFCIARIAGTLEQLAKDVYTKARATV